MDIKWIHLPKNYNLSHGGGNAYKSHMVSALSKRHNIEPMGIIFDKKNKIRSGLNDIYRLMNLKGDNKIWVREYLSTLTIPFDSAIGNNLLVVHHIDSNYLSYPRISKILDKLFYHNLKYIDHLVVVSQYWKNHFESYGHNPKLIYNCFNFSDFNFSNFELNKFKEKYNLPDKPIIYLGNCQESKGVVESYKTLKSLDVNLVTSGSQRVDIPAINLNLNYRDYLILLKVSSVVVTMSKFKEGWCRTAHEAMLCKTPVVGSGLGGMKELLQGGQQLICEDFNDLRSKVVYLMQNPNVGIDGFNYASQEKFSIEFFEEKWNSYIDEIYNT